jgi:DNA polymerase IV
MRRILHIDMDAFFAAVEEQRRPEIKGKPVVIGGSGNPLQRGVVSTANYEARKFGIHSALPLQTAYKLCPQAIFLPVDYEMYVAISRKFKEVLHTVSPVMEDGGIDEAYLDVSTLAEDNDTIIRQIKDGIKEKTNLTCSIGIAPNRLLAKMASDMHKPDGVTILNQDNIESLLWPLPIRKLYGVGPKTEEALKKQGIDTIGKLASLSLEVLAGHFGNSYGSYLFDAARGIDDSELATSWEPKSMSRETTFQDDVGEWQTIARTLADLTKEVVHDMRERQYKAKTFTVKIRFDNFQTLTRAKTLDDYTDAEDIIRKAAFACLKRIELKKKVRLIGMRANNLQRDG